MIKLVYHSHTFGPISLEYQQPTVTVGCEPGNDLVLPHPSVRPRHCQLLIQEESVIFCPWSGPPAEGSGDGAGYREYFVGDQMAIGEVCFEVRHSTNTVSIPRLTAPAPATLPPTAKVESPIGAGEASTAQHYCDNCQAYFTDDGVTRIGLKGRPKLVLCPQCSRPLVFTPPAPSSPVGFFTRLAARFRGWKALLHRHPH